MAVLQKWAIPVSILFFTQSDGKEGQKIQSQQGKAIVWTIAEPQWKLLDYAEWCGECWR